MGKVEDLMMREEEEDEDEEYIHFTPMRFCRTDEKGSLATPGKFFPNYNIIYNRATNVCEGINWKVPRPKPALRDDTYLNVVMPMEPRILAKAPAVGMFYSLTEASDGSLGDWAVGSYAVYLVNGKRIGITVLHTLKKYANERFFVDPNADNWKDKSYDLNGASSFENVIAPLVEVFAHAGAITQRANYINSLESANKIYMENLDPEFGQCSEPVLDVLMFEVPPALNAIPALSLASAAPAPDDVTLLIAFHNLTGGRTEKKKEYQFTTVAAPNPGDVVYVHRSVGVGKVTKAHGGIVNVLSSNAHGSSGAPFLNSQVEVFAINLGGFYDNPGKLGQRKSPDWTKVDTSNPRFIDVLLPENAGNVVGPKNRNIALSVLHSGFISMLAAIAP